MVHAALLLVLMLLIGIAPQRIAESQDGQPDNYPPISIPSTEMIPFTSESGQEYQLLVVLPENYAFNPNSQYRVVYFVDGNYYVGAVSDFIRIENLVQELPPLILVGIGYPENPLFERETDMYENPDQFVEFFANELIPFIDGRYRTRPDTLGRTLVGHSLGGAFVLHSLFSQPELFSRYVAASPGTPEYIFSMEADFAAQNAELPVWLYMSAAEGEDLQPGVEEMFATIEDRDYGQLEVTYQLFENATHGSSAIPAIIYGLRYVLGA